MHKKACIPLPPLTHGSRSLTTWSTLQNHTEFRQLSAEVNAPQLFLGIIRDSEDVYNLKNPTLFIFAENDTVIPLEQVSRQPFICISNCIA
jgi:hypothetical protein